MNTQTEIKADEFIYFKDTKPIKLESYNQYKMRGIKVITIIR